MRAQRVHWPEPAHVQLREHRPGEQAARVRILRATWLLILVVIGPMLGCAAYPGFSTRTVASRNESREPDSRTILSNQVEPAIEPPSQMAWPSRAQSPDIRLANLDRATRELIERELADAPASERAALIRQLANMDPAQARLVLKHRRAALLRHQPVGRYDSSDEPSVRNRYDSLPQPSIPQPTDLISLSGSDTRHARAGVSQAVFRHNRPNTGIGRAGPWPIASKSGPSAPSTGQSQNNPLAAGHSNRLSGRATRAPQDINAKPNQRGEADVWYGHSVEGRHDLPGGQIMPVPPLPRSFSERTARRDTYPPPGNVIADIAPSKAKPGIRQFEYQPELNEPLAESDAEDVLNPFAEFEDESDAAPRSTRPDEPVPSFDPLPAATVPPLGTGGNTVDGASVADIPDERVTSPVVTGRTENSFETDEVDADSSASAKPETSGLRFGLSKISRRLGFGVDAASQLSSPSEPSSDPASMLRALIARAEADLAATTYSQLETEHERTDFVRRHVELRLMYLIAGHSERVIDSIPGIESAEQEYWQQVLWSLTQYFDSEGTPDRAKRLGQSVAQLRQAVRRLQEEAQLEIRNANFCRKITSYGDYERFASDEFSAGQPVLMYAEIDNFRSQPTTDGRYRTLLKSTIEIRRDTIEGETIDSVPFPGTEDLCSSPRRDYFHSYEFAIPQRITPGRYVLKLTIEDQLSGRTATESVNLTVR